MATANQIVIALFGAAPGAYKATIQSIDDRSAVARLLEIRPLSNTDLSRLLTDNLIGNTVAAELKSNIESFIANGLSNTQDPAAFVISLIDTVASWTPDDPLAGATAQQFINRQSVADFHYKHGGNNEFSLDALTNMISHTDALMLNAVNQMMEVGKQSAGSRITQDEAIHVSPTQGTAPLDHAQLELIAALRLSHQFSLDSTKDQTAETLSTYPDGVHWEIRTTLGEVNVPNIVFHLSQAQLAEAIESNTYFAIHDQLFNKQLMPRYWFGGNESYALTAGQFNDAYGSRVIDEPVLDTAADLRSTAIRGEFHSAVSIVGLSHYLDILEHDSTSWTVISATI